MDEYGYSLQEQNTGKIVKVIYGQGLKGDEGDRGPIGRTGDDGDPGRDGQDGDPGDNLKLRLHTDDDNCEWLQWAVDDPDVSDANTVWYDLIKTATLTGAQGSPGAPGQDGVDGVDGRAGRDAAGFTIKGTVPNEAALPEGEASGSLYIALDTSAIWVVDADGSWDNVGVVSYDQALLDLYAELTYVDATFATKAELDVVRVGGATPLTSLIRDGQPGDKPAAFSEDASGAPLDGADLEGPVSDSAFGKAHHVTGQFNTATRNRVQFVDGRVYEAIFRFERTVSPQDPAGDAVSMRIEWLDTDYNTLGFLDLETINPCPAGIYERDYVFSTGGQINSTVVAPPAGTTYAVPYLRTFGLDSETKVAFVELRDISWRTELKEPVIYPPDFVFPEEIIPPVPYDVARTFYVVKDFGSDGNDGNSLEDAFATIGAALAAAAVYDDSNEAQDFLGNHPTDPEDPRPAAVPVPVAVIVHPGEYLVRPETLIPPNVTLYGYDLRATKLILSNAAGTAPATGDEMENNMFLMSNGIKVRGFTFLNLRHEAPPTPNGTNAEYIADDTFWTRNEPEGSGNYVFIPGPNDPQGRPNQRHNYLPTKGYVFAFNPNEIITRSPYIADCSSLHSLSHYDQMLAPLDPVNGNPDVGRGQGNAYLDGAILHPYTQVRSIVVDSFTSINPNGVGYAIVNNAFVQLVSVFTNWAQVGIWSHNGGHVTLANSNTTFGDLVFAATGYRNSVQLGDIEDPNNPWDDIDESQREITYDELVANKNSLATGMYNAAVAAGMPTNFQDTTIRDSGFLIEALQGDVRRAQDNGIRFFYQRLFDWDGNFVGQPMDEMVPWFLASFVYLRDQAVGYNPATENMVTDLMNAMINSFGPAGAGYALPSTAFTTFSSLVEATGQQLSYAGAGVNYNALPVSQGGTAAVPDPANVFLRTSGGRVYATFSTETGDTYLGEDLRVDYERSTIEGQAFSRGVQNIALPLIIGLGG